MANKIADLIVKCLENEGVEYIFGIPGEENIDLIAALCQGKIRFILTRHEQGASFMADVYGRLTRKAGVCLATLGPGAINLMLGAADANLDSSPLIAIAAQASRDRLYKESHQIIDLVALFQPVCKWVGMIQIPETTNEIVRKAFKQAQMERAGAAAIIIPEDIAALEINDMSNLAINPIAPALPKPTSPNMQQIKRAAEIINKALNPIILAGHGVCRANASQALSRFMDECNIPVATTFMAKGVVSDNNPLCIGTIGFMRQDYINFGFDKADVIITVGYDLVEYSPANWNPQGDKKIIHLHSGTAEVDSAYAIKVGIQGDLSLSLEVLAEAIIPRNKPKQEIMQARQLLHTEIASHQHDVSFPLKPQKIVADIRAALSDNDLVLCDTGALKMWMARLFPCYQPDTCLISNSLATMGFSLPGAIAAKLIDPKRKVIAAMGDGAFLMNSQELETAKRENVAFVVLIWRDNAYGLIEWKQEMEFGQSAHVKFTNPDFVTYAQSFGIKGYQITKSEDLLPTLKQALASDELVIIDCPVDYTENIKLIEKLASNYN
jgi:acetolactate synthase I/II/III large subunit